MEAKSGGDIPEIMILSDDDDDEISTTKVVQPTAEPAPDKITISVESPSSSKIVEPEITISKPEVEKSPSAPAPALTPVFPKETVVMDVDDDSDLELIEEVHVMKKKPSPPVTPSVAAPEPTQEKVDPPVKVVVVEPKKKVEEEEKPKPAEVEKVVERPATPPKSEKMVVEEICLSPPGEKKEPDKTETVKRDSSSPAVVPIVKLSFKFFIF